MSEDGKLCMHSVIGSQTVTYRPGVPEDAAGYVAHMNRMGGESDFLSFAGGAYFLTEDQVRDYIDGLVQAENQAIFVAELPDRLVGQVTLESSARPRLRHASELRIGVARHFWGKGVARHLMKLAVNFFESNDELTRLALEVSARNERGIALYRNFGFQEEGIKRMAFKVGDEYDDLLVMARLKTL